MQEEINDLKKQLDELREMLKRQEKEIARLSKSSMDIGKPTVWGGGGTADEWDGPYAKRPKPDIWVPPSPRPDMSKPSSGNGVSGWKPSAGRGVWKYRQPKQ